MRLALALVLGLAAGCSEGDRESGPGSPSEAEAALEQGGQSAGRARLRFSDVSSESGIGLVNVSGEREQKLAIPENIGQGAAVLDYDADGLLDVFIANGDRFGPGAGDLSTRSALYRGLGEFEFRDVSKEAGLDFVGWAHGASAVDFDADGASDLYVTVYKGPNRFFRNRGDGTFEDAAERWGGADPGPSTAAAFFDADADGDLDLYVGNYVHYDPEDPPNDGNPCEWKGLAVSCGPQGTTPAADSFYENREGKLVATGEAHGFSSVEDSYTLGAATGDFDADGDVDLYVANDSRANYLFENLGQGRFREAAIKFGVDRNEDGRPQAGMGVDVGDVDNDGRFDIFVTNFSHDTNALYHNFETPSGRTMFDDATYVMKLGKSSFAFLSWGTRIVDLDFDGWQDLVVVSGHVYPQVDQVDVGTSYRQRNQVFRNLGPVSGGGLVFREEPSAADDAFARLAVSRGLVQADFDNDGDADFLIVELDDRPTLCRNDTRCGHWIGFSLRGVGANRDAIGARLELTDSAGVTRWRERSGGGSYLSSCDPRLVFGLGQASGPIESLRVHWPSGEVSEYSGLAPDRYWLLEPEADPR